MKEIKVFFCHNNKDNKKKWVWSIIQSDTFEWLISKDSQDEAWDYCFENEYYVIGCKLLGEF